MPLVCVHVSTCNVTCMYKYACLLKCLKVFSDSLILLSPILDYSSGEFKAAIVGRGIREEESQLKLG